MKEKTKNIIVSVGFFSIIILVFLANIIVKDKEISLEERRKLAQFPKVIISKILNGDFTNNFDKYVTDQFIARNTFRSIKSFASINIFKQKDNNNLFEKDGAIYKMEYPLNTNNVQKSASKINEIYEKYLQNMNVYYSIIPEKNYYLESDGHLKMDYNELLKIVSGTLKDLNYIDISKSLELEDYYRTDLHWRQEKLGNVVDTIRKNMGLKQEEAETEITNINQNKLEYETANMSQNKPTYEIKNVGEFYGTYYGQLGVKVKPDNMYILTNEEIENCITYNYESKEYGKIYSKKNTADKYDIYLSGATPLITVENPNANTEKELLLFRDSFGSSIAPLLVQDYKKITLIDTRYISSKLLDQYIEFKDQDVLFLYSSIVLNQDVFK